MTDRPRFLFVCSRNQWRSPTAEAIYASDPRLEVRSAGLSAKSPRQLRAADLAWADLVLVMEREHRARILDEHRGRVELPPIEVLDIPDDYAFLDDELVEMLRAHVEHRLTRGDDC